MIRQVPLSQLPVRYVKGVGPAKANDLARLGIRSVEDLLWAVPRRYEDRSAFVSINQLKPGELATLRARVVMTKLRRLRGGKTLVEVTVGDGTGTAQCLWFNQPYLARMLRTGEELILHGRVEPGRRLQLVHPELERLGPVGANPDSAEDPTEEPAAASAAPPILTPPSLPGRPEVTDANQPGGTASVVGAPTAAPAGSQVADVESAEALLHMGRIVPIYPLTRALYQRWFRRVLRAAITHYSGSAEELIPAGIGARLQLRPLPWALEQMHFPEQWDVLEPARRRLAFEELFLMQVRLAVRRARLTTHRKPHRYRAEGPVTEAFFSQLSFTLTASQRQVLDELVADLCKPTPMLRLLQGDVGCGKTVVAAALMAIVAQSGYQVALMVPTELLAEQHRRVLSGIFEPLGVRVGLVSQAVSAAARRVLFTQIAEGAVQIVVGTHALIESVVIFKDLGLVVIDEQHKFGVAQRSRLASKARRPDVLVMTATPIPRTLALSFFGDLYCSTIRELPPGRQPVRTRLLQEAQRPDAYLLIRQALRQGRQGYVVYPMVEAEEGGDLKAATQMATHLRTAVFPEFPVGLLHGQMRPQEKDATMQAFVEGRIRLLVSTVIVEVGLDVPNATIMLIEHPERFGLAQLHQLRGRIGRGEQPSTCLAIRGKPSKGEPDETADKRLAAFAQTTDGFQIAEHDLTLRGPGDLLGRRQHGWLRFRVASLTQDVELLEAARQEAFAFVDHDPTLTTPEAAGLKQRLGKRP